jgi:hypothetical protein
MDDREMTDGMSSDSVIQTFIGKFIRNYFLAIFSSFWHTFFAWHGDAKYTMHHTIMGHLRCYLAADGVCCEE